MFISISISITEITGSESGDLPPPSEYVYGLEENGGIYQTEEAFPFGFYGTQEVY